MPLPLDVTDTGQGTLVSGPFVLERDGTDVENAMGDSLAYAGANVLTYNHKGTPVKLPYNSLQVAPDGSTIDLETDDGRQTVRRVTDEDGVWASPLSAPVPSDATEQLYTGRPYMSVTPFASTDEEMWGAFDPDTGDLVRLVYSSPAGVYIRADGGWQLMPDDDESLDGLEATDVDSSFLQKFDALESKGGDPLTISDAGGSGTAATQDASDTTDEETPE